MKLAITATAPQLDALSDPRFGRCAHFIVFDTESQAWEALPNPAAGAQQGAGTLAAQYLSERGVQAVVSGEFGPKAQHALTAANIQLFTATPLM